MGLELVLHLEWNHQRRVGYRAQHGSVPYVNTPCPYSSHYKSNRPQCTARLWLDWTSAQLVQFTLNRTISHGRVGAQYETVEPAGLSPFKELTSGLSFVQPRRKEGSGPTAVAVEGRLAPLPPNLCPSNSPPPPPPLLSLWMSWLLVVL